MDREQLHKLREAVRTGCITRAEAEAHLSAAIEEAYNSGEADMVYINACEDLLLELFAADQTPLPASEHYAAQMRRHMQSQKKPAFLPGWRHAAALAAVLLLVLVGGWAWFTGLPEHSQQVVQSRAVDVQTIRKSIASHIRENSITTGNFDEVVSFLGFTPKLPQLAGVEFTSARYTVDVQQDRILLTARFSVGGQEAGGDILYTVRFCTDADETYMLYEQEENGELCIIRGRVFYFAPAADRATYTWYEGTAIYSLECDDELVFG